MTDDNRAEFAEVKRLLADPSPQWFEIAAGIEALAERTRHGPEYQAERDWYRAYHGIDTDGVMATPEGRDGFRAGMLYAQCQRECAT